MFPDSICHLLCTHIDATEDSDEIPSNEKPNEPVYLNVYDMYKMNEYITNLGFGVFHSGVEVYGAEYAYGGHQHNQSGIFNMEPRNETILGQCFNMREALKLKESLHIGYTSFTPEEIQLIVNKLGSKFKGNNYNLISNNCNHFSAAFIKVLCRKDIPAWVNRLAYVTSFIPFLQKLIQNE